MISQKEVVQFVEQYKDAFEKIEPSFFEWTVGLAFYYFAKEEVDVAIIETGLGGRLDSTNVITPVTSLITNIGMDHMYLLGDTLQKIAAEKAGIIKSRVPVVISQYQPEVGPVFVDKAKELKAPIEFAEKNYKVLSTTYDKEFLKVSLLNKKNNEAINLELDLQGTYQVKNVMGVLNTVEFIRQKGFIIEDEHVVKALRQVVKLTGLEGRWQTISTKPLVIADTGHNEDGIKEVLQNLKRYTYKKLHIVLGTVNDKDLSTILALFPKDAGYYFCKASIPRALDEQELMAQAKKVGLKGTAYKTVPDALKAAKKQAKTGDLIFVGGSTFTVADIL